MDERRYAISDSIVIGYTPESEARRIVLDVRKHAELWPDAEVQLWVSRRGDAAPYIAQTAYADGEIIWPVTDYDTAMPGCGEAWAAFFGRGDSKLLALAGPSVVTVLPGPHGFATGTPPETTPPWAVQVIEAARAIGEGGSVTPEQIQAAVEAYLAENPVSSLPEGGVFKDALMINYAGKPEWRHAYWMQMWEEWDGFGVRVESGKSLLDTMKTLNLGLYSVYVKRGMPDNPPGAVETDSSLRGIIGVTTAKGDACYGWILLWDQDANCYMRYVRSGVASEWKQLNVPIDSTLSVSGAAADAKAVGEALAGIANGGGGSTGGGAGDSGMWSLIINQRIAEDCVSVQFDTGDNGEVLSEYDDIIIFIDLCANAGDYTSGVKVSFRKDKSAWQGEYGMFCKGKKLSEFTGRNICASRFQKTGAGVLPIVELNHVNTSSIANALYLSWGANYGEHLNVGTPFTVDGPDALDYETISMAVEFETIKIGGYQAVMGAGTVIKIWGRKA